MLQRTQSIVGTLWYLVILVFGIGFSIAMYQLLHYRDWQGYIMGALGGALFAIGLLVGRVLVRTRHGLVQRKYIDRLSPTARTFNLLNLLMGYATLAVEVQRWDAHPDWRRKLVPQYERFRRTLILVEQWRAEQSGERPRDLPALVDAALTASRYRLDDDCLRTLAALATESASVSVVIEAPPLPKPAI